MRTTQTNTVTLAATNSVAFYEWKGLTRLSICEQTDQTIEINDVDSLELLRAMNYYLQRCYNECDRNETATRILTDIAKTLAPLTAPRVTLPGEPAAV
jgi:hypothetical protein